MKFIIGLIAFPISLIAMIMMSFYMIFKLILICASNLGNECIDEIKYYYDKFIL